MKKIISIVFFSLFVSFLTWGQTPGTKSSTDKKAPSQTAAQTSVTTPGGAAQPVDEKSLKIDEGQTANSGTSPQAPAGLTIWDFVRMVLVLGVVIGLVVGFLWFLKRLSGRSNRPDDPIKVLYTHVLGGSRTLYLIEIGNDILLLGGGESGVNLILAITDQETVDAVRLASSRSSSQIGKTGFATLVGQLLGKKGPATPSMGDSVEQSSDFLKKQRDRLKNL